MSMTTPEKIKRPRESDDEELFTDVAELRSSIHEIDFSMEKVLSCFAYFAGDEDYIEGRALDNLGSSLGWPSQSVPDYFLFFFQVSLQNDYEDNRLRISRSAFIATLESLRENTIEGVARQGRSWLKDAFVDHSAEATAKLSRFHRLIFLHLLVSNSSDPWKQTRSVFVRHVPTQLVKPALVATYSILSPLVAPFCAFLDDANVKWLNIDQWASFLTFIRTVSMSLREHSNEDAWPCLLDDFVEWLRKNKLFLVSDQDGAAVSVPATHTPMSLD